MEKKLSICIPTYNRAFKLNTLLSFFVSEGVMENDSIELIVSNNASTDNTSDIIKKYQERHDKIIINNNKNNIGLAGNVMKLTKLAKGEYIWIVGDDDVLYDGIIKKIMNVLLQNNDLGHIFINHRFVKGEEILCDRAYNGIGGIYENGFNMFKTICYSSNTNLGVLMFISANIFSRNAVLECNEIIRNKNECNNLAIPLGYSLYCSIKKGYIINDVLINNDWEGISWSSQATLLHCRDMIAIIDIIGEVIGHDKEVNKLLIDNLPAQLPEFIYIKGRKKYGYSSDNYALKWLIKKHKLFLLKDIYKAFIKIFRKISHK